MEEYRSTDFDYLQEFSGSNVWVFSETKFRTQLVNKYLLESHPKELFKAFTYADALLALFKLFAKDTVEGTKPCERHCRLISEQESALLIASLVFEHKNELPVVYNRLFLEAKARLLPRSAYSIRRFFDALRLNETEDFFIKSLIDEYGNTNDEKRQSEELIKLLHLYEEALLKTSSFDPALLRNVLESKVSKLDKLPKHFPEIIVLDSVFQLFKRDHLLFRALAERTKLYFRIDENLLEVDKRPCITPTQAFARNTNAFVTAFAKNKLNIKSVEPLSIQRGALAKVAVDGDNGAEITKDALNGISVSICEDRKSEAKAVANIIAKSISSKEYRAEDFHILATDLDVYSNLIASELRKKEIPFSIPKGILLRSSAVGGALMSFLAWFKSPSLDNLSNYIHHSFSRVRQIENKHCENFEKAYKSSFSKLYNIPLVKIILNGKAFWEIKNDTEDRWPLDVETLLETLSHNYVLETFYDISDPTSWAIEILQHIERHLVSISRSWESKGRPELSKEELKEWESIKQTIIWLSGIHQEILVRESVINSEDIATLLFCLQRQFTSGRKLLSQIRRSTEWGKNLRPQLESAARVLREINTIIRRTRRTLSSYEALPNISGDKKGRFLLLIQHLIDNLQYGYAANRLSPDAVSVTELLDARGVRGKIVLVLGLTNRAFPLIGDIHLPFSSLYDSALLEILHVSGVPDRVEESYFILAQLIRHSTELYLFSPRVTEIGEEEIPSLLRDLASLGSECGIDVTKKVLTNNSSMDTVNAPANAAVTATSNLPGATLLQARRGKLFSAADGLIGAKAIAKLASTDHPIISRDEISKYSPSSLELLADCPHRFFFANILRLRQTDELIERVNSLSGEIVHSVLEDFFLPDEENIYRIKNELKNENGFSEACKRLLTIGEKHLEKSVVDWQSHPALREELYKILDGLSDPASKRRGYLKAALVFQKELLETFPSFVEYQFNDKTLSDQNGKAVAFVHNGKTIKIQGKIDRIDKDATNNIFAVLDYKTGKTKSFVNVLKGEALQVGLYAEAVRQNISPYKLPLRGICMDLSKPNWNDEERKSPVSGVLKEHLALSKQGRRYELELSGESTAKTVEQVINKVFALDTRVRRGDFTQLLETKSCRICDFKRICSRHEATLDVKLRHVEEGFNGTTSSENTGTNKTLKSPMPLMDDGDFKLNLNNFSKSDITLSSEQNAAADISKSVFLSAGAGSGKTAVLRARFMRLLLAGVPVENIVAITFTDKAAQEILTRIEEAISTALRVNSYEGSPLDDLKRTYLLKARFSLHEANIGTIHSFCGKILKMDHQLFGLISRADVSASGAGAAIIKRAVKSIMSSKDAAETIDVLSRYGIKVRTIEENLISLLKQERTVLELESSYGKASPQHIKSLENWCEKYLAEISKKREAHFRNMLSQKLSFWIPNCEVWKAKALDEQILDVSAGDNFTQVISMAKRLSARLTKVEIAVKELLSDCHELLSFMGKNSKSAKRVSKNNPVNYWKDLRDYLENALAISPDLDFSKERHGIQVSALFARLLFIASDKYNLDKEIEGAVDFSELINRVYQTFCERNIDDTKRDSLIRRLHSRFLHIMVDEFQDTDGVQWEIIKKVSPVFLEEQNRHHDTELPKPTIFLVGDDKQAIYRFRGSDPHVFRQAEVEIVLHNGESLSLRENYRSSPQVIDFVNSFFRKAFAVEAETGEFLGEGAPSFKHYSLSYDELKATRSVHYGENNKPVSTFIIDRQQEADEEDSDGGRPFSEASSIADHVSDICNSVIEFGSASPYGNLDLKKGGQIAILTRTRRQLLALADSLFERNIPYSIAHSGGFYDLDEIVQLENLLKIFTGGDVSIPLIGVLRSPLFGLTDEQLLELSLEIDGRWADLLIAKDVKGGLAGSISGTLFRYRNLASLFTPAQLLEFIVEDRELHKAYSSVGDLDSIKNIERFIANVCAQERQAHYPVGIVRILSWLEQERESPARAPTANRTSYPVVLSTVHGSKGLEYPMVILPFLRGRQHRDHDFLISDFIFDTEKKDHRMLLGIRVEDEAFSYSRRDTMLMSEMKNRERQQELEEERRIFYVAATRARDYLVLSFRRASSTKTEKAYQSRYVSDWLECFYRERNI